jgi:hypothetical protein
LGKKSRITQDWDEICFALFYFFEIIQNTPVILAGKK